MKRKIKIALCILINTMILMFLCGCDTTKPTDTVTVDIIIDTYNNMPPLGANVILQHNITSRVFSIENILSSKITFTEVPEGAYTLTVSLDGYQTYTANPLSVLSSMEVLVTLMKNNLATVTLDIRTSNVGAVSGAIVCLESSTEDLSFVETLSGNAHSVSFSNVSHGTYTLTVSLAGYQTYINEMSIQSSMEVSVILLPIITEATVYIEIGASDTGSIIGAVVSLVRNSTGESYTETVSENVNSVMFSGVAFGVYTLNVIHGTYYPYENPSLSVNSANVYSTVLIYSVTGVVLPSGYAWVCENEAWLFTLDNIYQRYILSVSGNNWVLDSSMVGATYYVEANQIFLVRQGGYIAKMTFAVVNGVLTVNIYEQAGVAVQVQKVFVKLVYNA